MNFREAAIQRRVTKPDVNDPNQERYKVLKALEDENTKAKEAAGAGQQYAVKSVTGPEQGFTDSDYGEGNAGAGIPYQVLSNMMQKEAPPPPPPPTPQPSTGGGGGQYNRPSYEEYRVKPGENLSSIAKRYGLTWQDIWNYNLAERSPETVNILKGRGPNKTYSNSMFYIPDREEAIRRRSSR
jgi:hypothetical protein